MNPMRALGRLARRLPIWARPRRFHQELDEELRFHLEMQTRWHETQGLSRTEARAEAEREFGGELRHREAVRDARGVTWLDDIGRDARFALRAFARTPGFTAVGLITLALGIGTSAAAFSIIDAVLVRPLPYPEPDRLVTVTGHDSTGNEIRAISAPNYYDWRDATRSFEATAIYMTDRLPIAGIGEPIYANVATVSGDFFRVMRTPAAMGRTLTPGDAADGSEAVVVSHGFWVRALGSPAALPAAPLRIGGGTHRIVGVLPAGREYPQGTDLFLPQSFDRPWRTASRNNINFDMIARLGPGVTIEQANADLATVAARVHAANPDDLYGYRANATTLKDRVVRPARSYLRILAVAVAVVLLVACVNLANATLARGAVRAREVTIRAALGAGRGRLVRQLLIEHLVLALAGGVLGIVLAWLLVQRASLMTAIALPRVSEVRLDVTVLAFALVLSVAVGVIVGLAPALQLGRGLSAGIAIGGRTTATRQRAASRDVLVGIELALALLLLVGAGLLVKSFRVVLSQHLGFEPGGAIAAELMLPSARYQGARTTAFYDELFASLRAVPGVTAVGATSMLPLGDGATGFIEVEGRESERAGAGYRVVTDGYFEAMGIPLVRGRLFSAGDDSGTTRVTVVNQRMAQRYWPGDDPIGKRFRATSMEWQDKPWLTVVGVVGDVRQWGFEQEAPVEHYVLARQRPASARALAVIVRGGGDPSRLMEVVRARIRAIDPEVPAELGTLGARIDRSVAERRFIMAVLTLFGGLALVLAAVGVYGVFSFTVAQRTREIAVRMALGAERGRVMRLVVGHVVRVSAVAVIVGLLAARGLSRVMAAMLFEVSPADPATYVVGTVVLFAAAVLAAYLPARRAASVDPMMVLRSD